MDTRLCLCVIRLFSNVSMALSCITSIVAVVALLDHIHNKTMTQKISGSLSDDPHCHPYSATTTSSDVTSNLLYHLVSFQNATKHSSASTVATSLELWDVLQWLVHACVHLLKHETGPSGRGVAATALTSLQSSVADSVERTTTMSAILEQMHLQLERNEKRSSEQNSLFADAIARVNQTVSSLEAGFERLKDGIAAHAEYVNQEIAETKRTSTECESQSLLCSEKISLICGEIDTLKDHHKALSLIVQKRNTESSNSNNVRAQKSQAGTSPRQWQHSMNASTSRGKCFGFVGQVWNESEGVEVTEVMPGTPAAVAGLKRGDIILGINDIMCCSLAQIKHLSDSSLLSDDSCTFHVFRGETLLSLVV